MNTTLPDDIGQLKALILAQQAVIKRLSGEITGYGREIATLTAQIAKLQRMLFGQSSEKNREKIEKKIAKAEKRITALQEKLGTVQSQLTSMAGGAGDNASDSPARKALPATLPRDRKVIPPQETECPACRGKLKPLGESVSEQLDIINTAFRVIETVRPKLACSRCDSIVQAPLPPKPIERSYASPGLLARIIMAKFAEHLPLYRQAEIYARQGVELNRNTMGRWVETMAEHPTAITMEALNRIGELYAIESEIRGSPAEERLAVRKSCQRQDL